MKIGIEHTIQEIRMILEDDPSFQDLESREPVHVEISEVNGKIVIEVVQDSPKLSFGLIDPDDADFMRNVVIRALRDLDYMAD